MIKQYKKEKFKDRNEALIWCADNKPIYRRDGFLDTNSVGWSVFFINGMWQNWHKAIEIVPEKRVIEVWVNVQKNSKFISYDTEDDAEKWKRSDCLGTVKLSKEITIIDGKVCDE